MLTPKQLYIEYSTNPCTFAHDSPTYTQLSPSSDIFNQLGANAMGAGTPINWLRIINFFKQVKYPCLQSAPGYDDIVNTGKNKLSPTFKFLQLLDSEAYKECQPTVRAGTSYSVRNCCDLSRACYFISNNKTDLWHHRMATEYLEYFGSTSLPDCLMLCGPDLVDPVVSKYYRAPGYKVNQGEPIEYSGAAAEDPDRTILNNAVQNDAGMRCFTSNGVGVAGADHACITPPGSDTPQCRSCGECPTNPISGDVLDPSDTCCNNGSIYYYNECCNNHNKSISDRTTDWSLWIKSDDGSFDGTILRGRLGEVLRHVGILERKIYHGYGNFSVQCSGKNPPITLDDLFLQYFQTINGWNYSSHSATAEDNPVLRARTISLLLKATASRVSTNTDTQWMVNRIKDLLYNGYGVMLLSNVGFNNTRDSTGVSYPDRTFYHTYNIIGYDDTKVDYNECVYVLQLPFGEWNTGGHPAWGPLPTGSFLVTESHLKCLINYYPTRDYYGCRQRLCINSPTRDCNDPVTKREYQGCGAGLEGQCDPYYCTAQQRACGFVFAVSLNEGFPKQSLNYNQFFPIQHWKEKLKTKTLFYKP